MGHHHIHWQTSAQYTHTHSVLHTSQRKTIIQMYLQLSNWYSGITFIESIWYIPSQWSKLPTFLHQCMKKAQAKQQFLPYLFERVAIRNVIMAFTNSNSHSATAAETTTTAYNIMRQNLSCPDPPNKLIGTIDYWSTTNLLFSRTSIKEFSVRNRISHIWLVKILPKACWWFICHLHTILQYSNRKLQANNLSSLSPVTFKMSTMQLHLVWWVASKPQSKIRMNFLCHKLLTNFFHSWHPWHSKVTVLKNNPCPICYSFVNHFSGNRTLIMINKYRSNNKLRLLVAHLSTCPWPREIALNFSPENPLSSANFSRPTT